MCVREDRTMRTKLLKGVAISAAVLLAAAAYVVIDGPGGIAGLTGEVGSEARADQVLAGIKAESPFVAVLEAERPDIYGALRDALVAEAEAGNAVQRMARAGRRFVAGWLQRAIADAPDDIALDMLSVTTAALRELARSDPEACAAFAEEGAASFRQQVSVTLRGRIDDIHMRLAAVPAGAGAVTLPQVEIDAAHATIAPALQAAFGDDVALLDGGVAAEDAARACEVQIALLEAYAGLGSARAAALARSLLGPAQGTEAVQAGS
jgi:hypothetical protein